MEQAFAGDKLEYLFHLGRECAQKSDRPKEDALDGVLTEEQLETTLVVLLSQMVVAAGFLTEPVSAENVFRRVREILDDPLRKKEE